MAFAILTYDEILNKILADYVNQFPGADISKGSLIYIDAAAEAAVLWGLYQHQRWVAAQIFPDTADVENLEHHAWIHGLSRKPGESDADLLARLLDFIRQPPAGGNKYDYIRWAKEITGVSKAWCISLAQGPGTVDVIVLADIATTGSEIPSNDLLAEVRAHIVDIMPTTVKTLRVLPPDIITADITITCTGNANLAAVSDAIEDYVKALLPEQTLYLSQLSAIAISWGATDVVITEPAANVESLPGEIIRPGVISVT